MMAVDPTRQLPRGNYKRLVDLAGSHVPPISAFRQKEQIVEGWKGKTKGVEQILIERRLIDLENFSRYSMNDKKTYMNYKASVMKTISRDNLTTERVR